MRLTSPPTGAWLLGGNSGPGTSQIYNFGLLTDDQIRVIQNGVDRVGLLAGNGAFVMMQECQGNGSRVLSLASYIKTIDATWSRITTAISGVPAFFTDFSGLISLEINCSTLPVVDYGCFKRAYRFSYGGGAYTLSNLVHTPLTEKSNSLIDVRASVVGNHIDIEVQGLAATDMYWTSKVETILTTIDASPP